MKEHRIEVIGGANNYKDIAAKLDEWNKQGWELLSFALVPALPKGASPLMPNQPPMVMSLYCVFAREIGKKPTSGASHGDPGGY